MEEEDCRGGIVGSIAIHCDEVGEGNLRQGFLILSLATLSAPLLASQATDLSDIFGGGALEGEELEKALAEASKHPVGSEQNPVRVNMPAGQRAYLSRLRCENGKKPKFERGGSVGANPFGSIVDVYKVECGKSAPGNVSVYLDMYHPRHHEDNAVPGFTIVAK